MSFSNCAGQRSKLGSSRDWCIPPNSYPSSDRKSGDDKNDLVNPQARDDRNDFVNPQARASPRRASPREVSPTRPRTDPPDLVGSAKLMASSASNTELREQVLVDQVRKLQERVHIFEEWRAAVQVDLNQLKLLQQQQPQQVIGKPSTQHGLQEESAATPREKQLNTTQQQLDTSGSVEQPGVKPTTSVERVTSSLSNGSALTDAAILERLKRMEAFEEQFVVQVETHRRLKDQVKHLETTEAFMALQKQVDAHDETIQEMKSKVKEIAADKVSPFANSEVVQIASIKEGSKPRGVGQTEEGEEHEEEGLVREIEGTVWDAMIFVFVDHIGHVNSVFMIAAFIIAFCIQWIFILIVQTDSFTGSSLPSVEIMRAWRYTIAHDHRNINPLARTSLATMICAEDGSLILAGAQAQVLDSIRSYLEPLPVIKELMGPSGHLLCVMSMLVWSMVIARELWFGCFQMFVAVVHTQNQNGHTQIYNDIKRPQMYVLHSMNVIRKCMVLVLLFVRFSLSVLLFHSGNLWLAYDADVSSLLLNCTALGLVLDIGTLTYAVMMPHSSKLALKRFKGLPLPNHGLISGIFPPISALILMTLAVIYTNFYILSDQTQQMRDIESVMCSGNQNFVFFIEPVSHYYMATPSMPFGSAPSRTFLHYSHLTQELGRADNVSSVVGVKPYHEWPGFSEAVDNGFTAVVEQSFCNDFPRLDALNMQSLTIRAVYDSSITNCSDLSQYCTHSRVGSLARLTCPHTCGCRSVYSGLVPKSAKYGCPMHSCTRLVEYKNELASIQCVDKNLTDLVSMPGWNAFFLEIHRFEPLMVHKAVSDAVYLVRDGGCSKVTELRNTTIGVNVPGTELVNGLCKGTVAISGIMAFCPQACHCKKDREGCPTTCPL